VEYVAGVEDYQVALAAFRAACETLARYSHHLAAGRARVIEDSRLPRHSRRVGGGSEAVLTLRVKQAKLDGL